MVEGTTDSDGCCEMDGEIEFVGEREMEGVLENVGVRDNDGTVDVKGNRLTLGPLLGCQLGTVEIDGPLEGPTLGISISDVGIILGALLMDGDVDKLGDFDGP